MSNLRRRTDSFIFFALYKNFMFDLQIFQKSGKFGVAGIKKNYIFAFGL